MVVTGTNLRRVGISAQLLRERGDAGELLIHALAQLPRDLSVSIPAPPAARTTLRLIARAYQIEERVTFDDAESDVLLDRLIRDGGTIADVVESQASTGDEPSPSNGDDTLFEGHRVAIVTNVATHYRVPLFCGMARRLDAAGARLRVYFLADVPAQRAWMQTREVEFDHEILNSVDLRRDRGRRLMPLNLAKRLEDFRPTLLLASGFSPLVAARAAGYASRRQIPFGVWSGEIGSRPSAQGRVRRVQRKWIIDRAAFALAYGWESARYLRSLATDLPLVIGRNTTQLGPVRVRPNEPKTFELLTVGRLERGKALDVILAAVTEIEGLPCRLTVIGDGPELGRLRQGADNRVRFLGARTPEEVREAYSKADLFLFPSRYDIFGLVLVEAMGAGMPVVVSRAVGSVADLAVDGVNALVVDDHEPRTWADAIARLVRDHGLRASLGASAQSTIGSRWTTAHAVDAMLAGLRLPLLPKESAV